MKAWYRRIKKRRGSKIARVAVMRRLATILWHMVKHNSRTLSAGYAPPPSWEQCTEENVSTINNNRSMMGCIGWCFKLEASSPRRAGQSEVFNGLALRAKRLFD